jgi:hypothetical protein
MYPLSTIKKKLKHIIIYTFQHPSKIMNVCILSSWFHIIITIDKEILSSTQKIVKHILMAGGNLSHRKTKFNSSTVLHI